MPQIAIGDLSASEVFTGDMGIIQICLGDSLLYSRIGSYLYIELSTETEE